LQDDGGAEFDGALEGHRGIDTEVKGDVGLGGEHSAHGLAHHSLVVDE
jgi:hypothetical protein